MKNFIQKGNTMTFTAGATITAGQLVLVGVLVGVALNDAASGEECEMAISGVFEVGKVSGAIGIGVAVYYNASEGKATTTVSTNKQIGWCWVEAASDDTTVKVRLLL